MAAQSDLALVAAQLSTSARGALGLTGVAIAVVVIELWAIAFIQNRYMQTPFWRAALQVVVGGALVFAAGIIIGSA